MRAPLLPPRGRCAVTDTSSTRQEMRQLLVKKLSWEKEGGKNNGTKAGKPNKVFTFKLKGLSIDEMEAAPAAAPSELTTMRFPAPRQHAACTLGDVATRMRAVTLLPFWPAAVPYEGVPNLLAATRAWQHQRHGVLEPARGMVLIERTHVSRVALGEELTLHALGVQLPVSTNGVSLTGARTRRDPAPPCAALVPCNGQAALAVPVPWDKLKSCRCGLVIEPPLGRGMAQKKCTTSVKAKAK